MTKNYGVSHCIPFLLTLFISFSPLTAEPVHHTVVPGDSLFALALEYNISVDDLIRFNSLEGDRIFQNQVLDIPVSTQGFYIVQSGDSLSDISRKTGTPLRKLKQLNSITEDRIYPGQELQLVSAPKSGQTYEVQKGDTLSRISVLYDISQSRLMQINNLDHSLIQPGQLLTLTTSRPQIHTVAEGDSLWNLARLYNLNIDDLISYNALNSQTIQPGQQLALFRTILPEETLDVLTPLPAEQPQILLAATANPVEGLNYLFNPPIAESQPGSSYGELAFHDPSTLFKKGESLLEELNRSIDQSEKKGNSLEGYHIMIDPGHGGYDPGCVIQVEDGNGDPVFIVEDEYVYDVSLRLYRELRLEGAEVGLTIISPNHGIRNGEAGRTFVNQKNELYNIPSLYDGSRSSKLPIGGREGLSYRVEAAESFFTGVPRNRRIFISLHADNNPGAGEKRQFLYHEDDEGNSQQESRNLARIMAATFGEKSVSRGQHLYVLNGNPADRAILIELRNLYYPGSAWAIRDSGIREMDARLLTRALKEYVKKEN